MKPTHTKLDSFEFGTELLSWEKLEELRTLPGVDHIRSYTSAVDHRTKIVEVEGTASGLRAVRAKLGVPQKPQKPKKPAKPTPSLKDKAIRECKVVLGMIQADLRNSGRIDGLDTLRATHLLSRLADVVVYLAQLHGETGSNGEMMDNLAHYLANRNQYRAMSLRWVCSKDFERL
jgi:hypothetical protein